MSKTTEKSQGQKNAEAESFRQHLGPFVAAAEATRMAMVFTDATEPDNPIIFANDSSLALTGHDRDEVLGKSFNFLLANRTDPGAPVRIKHAFEDASGSGGGDVPCRRKDGSGFWAALFVSPVRGESGGVGQHFASFVDLTGHKEDEAKSKVPDSLKKSVRLDARDQ